jgi:molybdopterin synthase catalytic subunit
MIRVQEQDFDIKTEINAATGMSKNVGAVVSFTGIVRSDDGLTAMTLEHYPGMTERELNRIALLAKTKWPLQSVRIIHRIGRLTPGENIVLVVTASRHRQAAFNAANFLMDYLKTDAPFWKYEERGRDALWIERRTSDEIARARWEQIED